jgi:hypothetical protein
LRVRLTLVKQRLDALEHLCLVDAAATNGTSALRYVLKCYSLAAYGHPHIDESVFVYAGARTSAIINRQRFLHSPILLSNSGAVKQIAMKRR